MEFQLMAQMADEPGTLDRALLVFSRRRICPRAVVATEDPERGLMELTVRFEAGSALEAKRLAHQVARGVLVQAVTLEPVDAAVDREMALVRVRCGPDERDRIREAAERLGAEVAAEGAETVVISLAGASAEVRRALSALAPFDIDAVSRVAVRVLLETPPPPAPELPPLPRYIPLEEDTSWPSSITIATPIHP
jgi:acetolactate synthase small subunit